MRPLGSTPPAARSAFRSAWPLPGPSCWLLCRSSSLTRLNNSKVLAPAQQQRVSDALEDDAEIMRNSHLDDVLAGQPTDVKAEVIHINTDARPKAPPDRPASTAIGGAGRAYQRIPDGAIAGQEAIEIVGGGRACLNAARPVRGLTRPPSLASRRRPLPTRLGAVFRDPGLRGLQLGDRQRPALPGSRNESARIAGRIQLSSLTTATRSNEAA